MFDALVSSLAEFGVTLEEKTTLTFAPLVLKALATLPKGGRVVVLCAGTPAKVAERFGNLTADEAKQLHVVTCDAKYSKVRPHVLAPIKAKNIAHGVTLAMKDADKNAYGFSIVKR